jgi:hypothetical protein
MAAMLSGQQFLMLAEPEAQMLGNALYDVAEEYGITLSGPRAVWIKLAAAVGMIYGPRAVHVMQENAKRKQMNGVSPTRPATPAPAMQPGATMDFSAMQ